MGCRVGCGGRGTGRFPVLGAPRVTHVIIALLQ